MEEYSANKHLNKQQSVDIYYKTNTKITKLN
jgi:hypothetical protein